MEFAKKQNSNLHNKLKEAIIVEKAAHKLRKNMLVCKSKFQDGFDHSYISNCIPKQLQHFVHSILYGNTINSDLHNKYSKEEVSLSNLIQFNCHNSCKKNTTSVIEDSGVATSGTADSFLKVCSITKSRNTLQITACVLYRLLKKAFKTDQILTSESEMVLEQWCLSKCRDQPTFKVWHMIIDLILTSLVFLCSIRNGNFNAYLTSFAKLLPFLFCKRQHSLF